MQELKNGDLIICTIFCSEFVTLLDGFEGLIYSLFMTDEAHFTSPVMWMSRISVIGSNVTPLPHKLLQETITQCVGYCGVRYRLSVFLACILRGR
jgi:hypothetical protein